MLELPPEALVSVSRRAFLLGASALALGRSARATSPTPMPAIYLPHDPFIVVDPRHMIELGAWGEALPRPTAIVVMTPHFGRRALSFGDPGPARVLYNVGDELARMLPQGLRYPSPPDAALGERIAGVLGIDRHVPRSDKGGLEYSTWMPLLYLHPEADVPVLELAYPFVSDAELFALGRRLAPLRDEGVLFVASGNINHNLASHADEPRAWAHDFDAWVAERLVAQDVDALLDWRHRAPAADLNHPDNGGHFRVLFFALGAGLGRGGRPALRFPVSGFNHGASRRCVEVG